LDNHPVTWINWNDAAAFCKWLNSREHQTARLAEGLYVRLPTEAEWEYACRAGTQTKFWWGEAKEDGEGRLNWNVKQNGSGLVAPVDHFGSRGRNPFGLADMLANAREWCLDGFDATGSYAGVGISDLFQRVLRGGCFFRGPGYARCAFRELFKPSFRAACTGFRVCCGPEPRPTTDAADAAATRVIESTVKPPTVGPNAPPPAVAPFDAAQAKRHQEAWAKHLGGPVEETNSLGMPLVLIPPGEFEMGATPEELQWALEEGRKKNPTDKNYFERVASEAPRHQVKISTPFYLATDPVTQGEYQKIMGTNPSSFTEKQMDPSAFNPPLSKRELEIRQADVKKVVGKDTNRHPVETVDWEDAVEFCHRLSALPAERAARRVYRLPTEAEWEYACRAGTTTRWYCGDDEAGVMDVAWFNKNARAMTQPVGGKKPNAWGLHDMSGNVWQWCSDRFSADYYKQSPASDPIGPPAGSYRVVRGGHWYDDASYCRSASRRFGTASRTLNLGFRVVVAVAAEQEVSK